MPNKSGINEPTLLAEVRMAKAWGVRPWELARWFGMARHERAMIIAAEREQARADYWSYEYSKDK